jgi:negative regulator of sigma-B (phosphoserine phosphatase)
VARHCATANPLTWAVEAAARKGDVVSGDVSVVCPEREGTLFAVIDGVGHGAAAAYASNVAADTIRSARHTDLPALAGQCHDALRDTRGAAIILGHVDQPGGQLTWLAVGNVTGAVGRHMPGGARLTAVVPLSYGLLGHRLGNLRTQTQLLYPGDVIVSATDGIMPRFVDTLVLSGTPQNIADRILHRFWRETDDGLIFVARVRGAHR